MNEISGIFKKSKDKSSKIFALSLAIFSACNKSGVCGANPKYSSQETTRPDYAKAEDKNGKWLNDAAKLTLSAILGASVPLLCGCFKRNQEIPQNSDPKHLMRHPYIVMDHIYSIVNPFIGLSRGSFSDYPYASDFHSSATFLYNWCLKVETIIIDMEESDVTVYNAIVQDIRKVSFCTRILLEYEFRSDYVPQEKLRSIFNVIKEFTDGLRKPKTSYETENLLNFVVILRDFSLSIINSINEYAKGSYEFN
ncbi:MAG: hypothetical protein LBK29_03530 [Oscillospiraceae bacterium]|nr:hypothetical protein [Oscillospiraceae bacterium]